MTFSTIFPNANLVELACKGIKSFTLHLDEDATHEYESVVPPSPYNSNFPSLPPCAHNAWVTILRQIYRARSNNLSPMTNIEPTRNN